MSSPPATRLPVGLHARRVYEVVELDTAIAVGSGSVPALGTPRLLAWLEAATVAAIEPSLGATEVSLGVHVRLEHSRPSAVGARVTVEAVVIAVEGRRIDCDVEAIDGQGNLVGRGRITRMVVDRDQFLDRLGPSSPG